MTLVEGPRDGATAVTVWTLETATPDRDGPDYRPPVAPILMEAERPSHELSRFFYQLVGGPWHWVDRLSWPDERWSEWVNRAGHRLVTCWVDGAPAGYYELDRVGRSTEIAYFGLAPDFIGQGLGRWLLSTALTHAWSLGDVEKVWLHTCSLDGPAALTNYRARGLEIVGETTEWRMLDD